MPQRNRANGAAAFALGRTMDAVAALAEVERVAEDQLARVRRLKALLKDTAGRLDDTAGRLDDTAAPWRDISADELSAFGEPISLERARARRRAN